MGRKVLFSFLIVLIIISMFGVVSAEKITSSEGVTYDTDLLKAFEDGDYTNSLLSDEDFIGLQIIDDKVWAKVLVNIKDNSGIEYSGTKEERLEQSKQRDKWFEPIIQEALDGITKTEIKNINKGFSGFGALVTKKAFEELISDDRIEKVIWSQYGPKPFKLDNSFTNITKILLIIIFILLLILLIFLFKKRMKKKKIR